jgi:hypothetical protein
LALPPINTLEDVVDMARGEARIPDRPTATSATSERAKSVKLQAVPE